MHVRRPRLRGSGPDDGFALVAVLGTMAVLSLFLVSTLNYSLQSLTGSRGDQDAKAAQAAAQAGIDDYLSRMNASAGNYTSIADVTDSPIAGTGAAHGTFSYQRLSTEQEVLSSSKLRLAVTGKSRGKTRRVVATLTPVGFLKYVYYTDIEAVDPVLYSGRWQATVNGVDHYSGPGNKTYYYFSHPGTVNSICSKYHYTGRTNTTYTSSSSSPIDVYEWKVTGGTGAWSYSHSITNGTLATLGGASFPPEQRCKNVEWVTGDVVDGPLHSNDALLITGGPLFTDPRTESSWPDGSVPAPDPVNRWWGPGAPSSSGVKPVYYMPVKLPPSNSKLRSSAASFGCVYTGATKITFSGTSMVVHSPNTTTTNAGCLDTSNRANAQTITPIPPAIYVEGTTATTCAGVGYPHSQEKRLGATPDHSCFLGNAYVSGSLKGKLTVGSDNDVVIVADLTYQSDDASTPKIEGTDVLGLIANNYVWVYHPVDASGANVLTGSQEVHNIHAAILSVKRSFLVQSWNYGAAVNYNGQKLNVTGSISQKFRGPVGTPSGSGYLKNYVYDARLITNPPPYFLQPDEAPWQVDEVSG